MYFPLIDGGNDEPSYHFTCGVKVEFLGYKLRKISSSSYEGTEGFFINEAWTCERIQVLKLILSEVGSMCQYPAAIESISA